MPLKIVRKDEPIEIDRITFTIFGDPASGKSTMAMTSDKPLVFDFDDGGSARAMMTADRILVNRWSEVMNIQRNDVAGYKTLVIDTVGHAVDRIIEHLGEHDKKLMDPLTGGLTQRGYGALKNAFKNWIKRVKGYGLDIVLVVHIVEDKVKDERVVRLDIAGQTKNLIYKFSDQMGYLYVSERDEHWFNCNPSVNTFGKNTGELEPMLIPPPTVDPDICAKLVAQTKQKMNEKQGLKTDDVAKAAEIRLAASERPRGDADYFNELVNSVRGDGVSKYLQQVVKDLAIANGLLWSKADGCLVSKSGETAQTRKENLANARAVAAKSDEIPEEPEPEPEPEEKPADVKAEPADDDAETLTAEVVNDEWKILLESKPNVKERREFINLAKEQGFVYRQVSNKFEVAS